MEENTLQTFYVVVEVGRKDQLNVFWPQLHQSSVGGTTLAETPMYTP
jgi:hypothetical protein